VLLIKKDKLIFILCAKCFDKKCNRCTYIDEERALIGTWTNDKLSKALENGYLIVKIYEVWYFKKSNKLFKEYVKTFMKIKLETSPWQNIFKQFKNLLQPLKLV